MSNDYQRNNNLMFVTLVCIIQVLIFRHLSFTPLVSVNILPCFLLLSKEDKPALNRILTAFAIGLFADIFGDGVLGLNAFSLVLLAAFLAPWMYKSPVPLQLLLINLIFFVPYTLLDNMAQFQWLPSLAQLGLSILVSLVADYFVYKAYDLNTRRDYE